MLVPSSVELFEAKLETHGDHLVWTGSRDHRGVGMVRINGKLRTVQRAAWEFAHGPLAVGLRVQCCADERACVRVDHLSISAAAANTPPSRRRPKGSGSIREISAGVWKVTVSDGAAASGRQRRRTATVNGRRADAERALATLLHAVSRDDLGDLRVRELVSRYLVEEFGAGEAAANRDTEILREVIEPTLGDDLAAVITPVRLERTLDTLARQEPHRRGAVRDAVRLLHRSYQWAQRRHWCDTDPTESVDTRWLGR